MTRPDFPQVAITGIGLACAHDLDTLDALRAIAEGQSTVGTKRGR